MRQVPRRVVFGPLSRRNKSRSPSSPEALPHRRFRRGSATAASPPAGGQRTPRHFAAILRIGKRIEDHL
jgi:hypothetical protein